MVQSKQINKHIKKFVGCFFNTIFTLTIITYLLRSAFPILKYLFLIFAFLTFLSAIFIIISNKKSNFQILEFVLSLKEIFLLAVFLTLATLATQEIYAIKEIVNFIVIIFIFYISFFFKFWNTNNILKLFELFIYAVVAIGIIGLSKFLFFNILEIKLPFVEFLNVSNSISLTTDYNFYSLFFIFAIIVLFFFKKSKQINITYRFVNFSLFILTLNILFSNSRRAVLVLVLLFIINLIKERKKITIVKIFVFLFILLSGFIVIRNNNKLKNTATSYLYRYSTIIGNSLSYNETYKKLWLSKEKNNLFYNSNLYEGKLFWQTTVYPDDILSIIDCQYGKAIRVERYNHIGDWSLSYTGFEHVKYYKGITYTFKFKYRVIKCDKNPFMVGWWLKENDKYLINLPKKITDLGDNWKQCECSYTFKENHVGNKYNLINTLDKNTIVDFTDIKLIHNDTIVRNIAQQKINNEFTHGRTDRWEYAIELFKEYTLLQKIFGNGFTYMEKFGEKFLPKNENKKVLDYPHSPILSAFLYSGIIGGLFYIYFLLLTFWYYWKYRKYHLVFFIMYIIAFFFTFVSGNSHFSSPIFVMLSIVPFVTKYIVNINNSIKTDVVCNKNKVDV